MASRSVEELPLRVDKNQKKSKKRVKSIQIVTKDDFEQNLSPVTYGPESFKVITLLGVGSQGRVYLVQLVGTNQFYAMKVFKKEQILLNEKSTRSILTEQRFLSTSRHPFVTSLLCSFHSHERLYMVMEYCCGGELFTLMKRQPHCRFTEDQIRFYSSEVLLVLEFVHLNGYIYRDLKPENILLHADGHIRMADFGLSKQSEKKPDVQLTENKGKKSIFRKQKKTLNIEVGEVLRTTSLVGSMQYLAPEVFSSSIMGGYDIMADWWAFGVLLYEMLYGTPPFDGESNEELVMKVINAEYIFPDDIPASNNIKSLIKGLLKVDPKKRLCGKHGANELKIHPFYEGINWGLLRHRKPPILPKVASELDTSNFDIYDEDLDPDPFEFFSDLNENPNAIPKRQQQEFENFTYYSPQFQANLTLLSKSAPHSKSASSITRKQSFNIITNNNNNHHNDDYESSKEAITPRRRSKAKNKGNISEGEREESKERVRKKLELLNIKPEMSEGEDSNLNSFRKRKKKKDSLSQSPLAPKSPRSKLSKLSKTPLSPSSKPVDPLPSPHREKDRIDVDHEKSTIDRKSFTSHSDNDESIGDEIDHHERIIIVKRSNTHNNTQINSNNNNSNNDTNKEEKRVLVSQTREENNDNSGDSVILSETNGEKTDHDEKLIKTSSITTIIDHQINDQSNEKGVKIEQVKKGVGLYNNEDTGFGNLTKRAKKNLMKKE